MVSYIYPCLKTEKYGKMKCCKYGHKNVFQNKQFLFSAPVQFQKQWHTPEILYLPNFCQIYIAVWNRIKLNSSTFQKFNQQAELTAEMKSLRIRKVFSQILRRVSVSEEQEVLFFFFTLLYTADLIFNLSKTFFSTLNNHFNQYMYLSDTLFLWMNTGIHLVYFMGVIRLLCDQISWLSAYLWRKEKKTYSVICSLSTL